VRTYPWIVHSWRVPAPSAQWDINARPCTLASVSGLGKQIEEVIATLNAMDAPFALIGGLALASHKVIRATQDVDLLADADIADEIDVEFTELEAAAWTSRAAMRSMAPGLLG
jgi:hypothetical protein